MTPAKTAAILRQLHDWLRGGTQWAPTMGAEAVETAIEMIESAEEARCRTGGIEMIDTKELRRLAQAATQHVGRACNYQDAHSPREGRVDFENADLFIASERPTEDAAFYAAANPAAISELLDRLEAAEKERDEFKRACFAHISDNALLQAKIAEMEKQEPFDADSDVFRSAFEAALKAGNWPATRQGDGYRSPSTQIAWRIAFSTVNRLKLCALPGAKGEEK